MFACGFRKNGIFSVLRQLSAKTGFLGFAEIRPAGAKTVFA
jgi:hypothetical protein